VRRWGELTDERVSIEASLADLHQRELMLEVGQAVAIKRAQRQLPTFARASQNVVTVAVLLDMLLYPPLMGWARCISG
jgi:hypothetical protein